MNESFDAVAYINTPRFQDSNYGLERTRFMLSLMGNPERRVPMVHVAGTNGKGSTCAYLASILQAAGYKVGLFTSPYLVDFEERIRVNGVNIPHDALTAITLRAKDAAEKTEAALGQHPTEFELMTVIGFAYFAECACDVAVIEVGLGGRLDSTNVIERPLASVITRLGLDHTQLLGNTLAEIAREKAGIIKPGCPVVAYPQEETAQEVIRQVAHAQGSRLVEVSLGKRGTYTVPNLGSGEGESGEVANGCGTCEEGSSEEVANGCGTCEEGSSGKVALGPSQNFEFEGVAYTTQLLGAYQSENASLAITTAHVLRENGERSLDIPDDAIVRGIASCAWPGRFEVVAHDPLVIIDGGHNPQGAQALAESLDAALPGVKPVFVMGVLADKDYESMLDTVLPYASAVVAVTPPNPRALSATDLISRIRAKNPHVPTYEALLEDAIAQAKTIARDAARDSAGATPPAVVCFGSLYSIGALERSLS